MNILIVSSNRSRLPMPVMPLGACIVADAAAGAGHRVSVLDLMFTKDPLAALRSALRKTTPDIVGLSVRNIDNNDLQDPAFFVGELAPLVDAIHGMSRAPLVLGGAAVSVMPEELLRLTGASWAVLGEGEVAFPMLLEKIGRGESPLDTPCIAWIDDKVFRKNPSLYQGHSQRCLVPDFHRWIDVAAYLSRLSTVPLQTKLGCHFKCVYCTYRKIEGETYRLSSPEGVVDAVAGLASRGLRDIEFVDNVFNCPHDHAMEICEGLARRKPGARLQSLELNPLFVDDVLIAAMEKAGFVGIGITVESASDPVLEGLGKGFTAAHIHRAAEIIRRHKLPCVWIFMLGGPRETRATVNETLRFAERFVRNSDVAFFNTGIRIYPGTELESIARKQGLLSLSHEEMIEPVFYLSPEVEYSWMMKEIGASMERHMNFLNADSIGLPFLPLIHRLAYRLGLRSPLWRHTRFIRRGLRLLGLDV